MALPQYNTEVLIENIKRRGSIPTSQILYLDDDFVKLANDEMDSVVVPLIMSTREEFFVKYEDFTYNQSEIIAIPQSSIGMKLRAVVWVQSTNPFVPINIPRTSLEGISGINYTNTIPSGFYIQDNSIIFYPNNAIPNGSTVRLYYFDRPLSLVQPSEYAQVQSIDSMTNTVVLNMVPSNFEVDSELNTVSSTPGFKTTNVSTTIVSMSSPSVTLSDITGISVGDYISEIGTSAIPQIPIEAHAWLSQLTVVKCLEGMGDREGMKVAQEKAMEMKQGMLVLINPRVDGSIKKIIAPNGGMKTFSGSRWGRWR